MRGLWTKQVLAAICLLCLLAGCAEKPVQELPTSSQQGQQTGDTADQSGGVTIFAGSFSVGFADGQNRQASFVKPFGLCASADGGLLIVDSYANLLRVSTEGTVSTLAGNTAVMGGNGYPLGSYLNGEADKAYLNQPRFAAVASSGAVVFSDTGNHRIRIVADGVVRLLAGSSEQGFRDGDYKTARFDTPSGVAIGAEGTVYVADTLNHCIRAISPDGVVSTLAGVPGEDGFQDGDYGTAQFCEPNDIQLGPDGALYVVDKGNQRIRRIADGNVSTVAGSGDETDPVTGYIVGGYQDGDAAQAQFEYPTGLCVAENGVIYVADTGNNCLRAVSPDGQVTTVAGTKMSGNKGGAAAEARFNQPLDVFCDDGMLYVSDSYNHAIRAVQLDSEPK